tara:strand:+ start:343 stop:2190 length:1848 start_codon:yes stop_codon:yes gene_type:complete
MSIFKKLFNKERKLIDSSIIRSSLFSALILFSSVGEAVKAKDKIYVGVEPLSCDLLKAISPSSNKVKCVINRKQDVHDLKITPRQAKIINSADKVFTLGKEMTPALRNLEEKSNTVVVGVSAIEVENPSDDESGAYEWAGVFDLSPGTYTWSFAKVDGEYADPVMKMVILESSDIEDSEVYASELLDSKDSITVKNNGNLVPDNKAYLLRFDQKVNQTVFNVEIKKKGKYIFFTEHMPFEFEADEHFFKDIARVDIEPISQEPDMGSYSDHGQEDFEWAGTFELEKGNYTWSFAKVDGEYADPAMKMVILQSSDIEKSEELASKLLESNDSINKSNNDVLVVNEKAYTLNFDQTKDKTIFNLEIKKTGKYTFFTEHMPFEFEADEHFLKDVSRSDIEPIAQVPNEEEGHHHHHHDHGHGSLDPHVWHDPNNVIKMINVISKNIKKDISLFNRKERKILNERTKAANSILRDLNNWAINQLSTVPESNKVITSKHQAMDYYGAAFGFETISLLDTLGGSSSLRPDKLSSVLRELKEDNVKILFIEQKPASKLLKNLSRQSSIPLSTNQIFVDGLMLEGNTISVAVHNTCTIVNSLGGQCDESEGKGLEKDWDSLIK